MPADNPVQLHRTEKLLALNAAFVALRLDPAHSAREEMCDLCRTVDDIITAVAAMRDAEDRFDKIPAALRTLRARRAVIQTTAQQ